MAHKRGVEGPDYRRGCDIVVRILSVRVSLQAAEQGVASVVVPGKSIWLWKGLPQLRWLYGIR